MVYKIFKNIFFVSSFLIYLTTYSLSKINSQAWSTECSEDKKICLAIITSETKIKDKIQTLATAYIQIGSSKQKKMNLINEDDQTYKLSEENKNVSVLFVKLPFNVDLKIKPAIIIDNKKLGDLNYSHCNQTDGCAANFIIDNDVIDFFRKGKTMNIVTGIYNNTQNMKIEFPLKNFSRSYAQLTKKAIFENRK